MNNKGSLLEIWKQVVWFGVLMSALAFVIIPLYLLFKYSISDIGSINTGGNPIPFWPFHPTLKAFVYLFSDAQFYHVLMSSLIIALATVLVSLVIGVPAAYVLGRYDVPFKRVLLIGLISVRLFPDIASVIPIAEFFIKFDAQNSYWGIVLAHSLLALPYVIFIGTSAFEPIPRDLEHQAMVMGASRAQILFKILLPLAAPGLAAAAIYTFLLSWDEFVFSYFLLGVGKISTLTLYLKQKLSYAPPQNILATISLCLSLPVIIFSLIMQKKITAGITSGAVK